MDAIRKLHNSVKREFISKWVQRNELVLDCGCGRGGDWHKWKAVGARVFAIDPDEESLLEAEKRAFEMKFGVWFLGKGDIRQAAFAGPYGYFKDDLGNEIAMMQGGRKLLVRLVDGPFYADGGREEPILDSNELVKGLANFGFELILWEPMLDQPNGLISDVYSKFVFKKKS